MQGTREAVSQAEPAPKQCRADLLMVRHTLDAEAIIDRHELGPDVFGEDLDQAAYRGVARIAAVGLCVTRRSPAIR